MTEPTYNFIPGQGWIPCTENKVLARQENGRAIWIIERQPLDGERFVLNYGKDPLDTFEKVAAHVANYNYENQQRWPHCFAGDKAWTLKFADE